MSAKTVKLDHGLEITPICSDFMVELRGFEPLISVVRAPCAPRDGATLKTQFVTMFEDGLLA
jgi:hypothetical protein